jgi:hypothetical protein
MAGRDELGESWPMDEWHRAFQAILSEAGGLENVPPERLSKVIEKTAKEAGKGLDRTLMKRAPKMLARRRKDYAGFEKRNLRRWRAAFDLMEVVWVCCEEIGSNFNCHFRAEAVESQDYEFEALTHLHARALLVVSEMICLMKGGFPDGALARWRTLHEINVVTVLIREHGRELALRYLAHAHVQAGKDITVEEAANDEKLKILKERADHAIADFGEEMENDYGWAASLTGKQKKPQFRELERLANRSDDRPLYKHASTHVHSNHRPPNDLLGTSESENNVLLVGQSNSGMTGPLALASASLVENTIHLINSRPNFDRTAFTVTLVRMSSRMHDLAEDLERRTLKAALKKRRPKAKRTAR